MRILIVGLVVLLAACSPEQSRNIGAQPKTSTPEELSRHIAAEVAKWQGVREKAGIPQL